MVLGKRLDYGFNGYQVLVIPRAARSVRRRKSYAKKTDGNQMSAFDLLATVAGTLLLETKSSSASTDTSTEKDMCTTSIVEKAVKNEHQDDVKPLKIEPYDQGSCDGKLLVPESLSHHSRNHAHSGLTSVLTSSECSKSVCSQKMEIDGSNSKMVGCKVKEGSTALDTGICKSESEINILNNKSDNMPINIRADMCSLDKPVAWDGKPAAGVSSDSSSKGPLYKERVSCDLYKPSKDDVNVVSRDDDENSSGFTHPSKVMGCTHYCPKTRFFRPSPRIGDRRIRKLLASRYWKVAPKLKNVELQNTVFPDREMKSVHLNRKNCYARQRSPRSYPFKKRKFFYQNSISNSNGKGINGDVCGSDLKRPAATRTSSSVAGQHSSFQCRDSHVKLRIQSFRVPELFIEIPETATVGSLKRTVMEAVNSILGGGLHVGLLLQGKKVRDDYKTLQQTGISQDKHLEALGFTLEPTLSQVSSHLGSHEETPILLPSDTPHSLTSYPPGSSLVYKGTTDTSYELHVANLGNSVGSDHDSAPSSVDSSVDKNMAGSKELVALPAISVEALAIVPGHHNSKRSEIAQRRIRRPFSVTEVEALVHAVEKLGTGRWRDVKLRSFDNAKHRTYVDLKDKWKTLVHTAKILPQQRRGESVPQELLDRVLAAHGYWTNQHVPS